jgi:TRAP-type C4-dicarboxylate transport system permease small subunit
MVHLRRLSDALNRAAISFIGFFYMQGTGEALSWTYSLARLFVPWIGMLSITIAFKGGEHVTMNLLLGLVPAALTRAMQWASVGLIGLFALLLLWFGWDFFLGSNQYYMVSDQIR